MCLCFLFLCQTFIRYCGQLPVPQNLKPNLQETERFQSCLEAENVLKIQLKRREEYFPVVVAVFMEPNKHSWVAYKLNNFCLTI